MSNAGLAPPSLVHGSARLDWDGAVLRWCPAEVPTSGILARLRGRASFSVAAPIVSVTEGPVRGRSAPLAAVAVLLASLVTFVAIGSGEPELRLLIATVGPGLSVVGFLAWWAEPPGLVLIQNQEQEVAVDPSLLQTTPAELISWLQDACTRALDEGGGSG